MRWDDEKEAMLSFIWHLRKYRELDLKTKKPNKDDLRSYVWAELRSEMAWIHGFLSGIDYASHSFEKKLRLIWNKLYAHLNKKD